MRIALIGYGRMGRMVESCMREKDLQPAGIVDVGHADSLADIERPDAAIDFSFPGDLPSLLSITKERNIPLVIGRTGLDDAQAALIPRAAESIPIVWSNNYSIGVAVMRRMAAQMARTLGDGWDIEIVETHHKMKQDAPSGTAAMLLDAVNPEGTRPVVYGREGAAPHAGEIGVHSLRGGTVAGEHTVRFFGDLEELSLSHRADSRRIFAAGALRAAAFVIGQKPGLYGMEDVLFGPAGEA